MISFHLDNLQLLLSECRNLLLKGDMDKLRFYMATISSIADDVWNETIKDKS